MRDKTFSDLLLSKPKLECLRFLLNNQEDSFTINEIAENVDASYTTVNSFVKDLTDFSVLKIEEKGSAKIVSVNEHSPYINVLEDLGSLDAKPLIETAEDYADGLSPENYTKGLGRQDVENISAIVLFGSVARGMPNVNSDIDILVLAEDQVEAIEELAHDKADKIGREKEVQISPLVMSRKKFERNLESGDPLANKIKQHGKALKNEEKWEKIIR